MADLCARSKGMAEIMASMGAHERAGGKLQVRRRWSAKKKAPLPGKGINPSKAVPRRRRPLPSARNSDATALDGPGIMQELYLGQNFQRNG